MLKEIAKVLKSRGWTLAVAESCTGGMLAARLTSLSGSSAFFLGGVVAYSNDIKITQVGVDRAILAQDGAVSDGVARALAEGIRSRFASDLGIGITGIAGPDGGTAEKPVGSVWIAVAGPGWIDSSLFLFDGDREAVRALSVGAALKMVHGRLAD